MRRFCFSIFFLINFICSVNAFPESRPVKLSKKLYPGYQLYEKEDFDQSIEYFLSFLSEEIDDETRMQAVFWLGKSYLAEALYQDAELSFRNYVRYGNDKDYLEESRYLIGRSLFLQGKYQESIDQLSSVFFNNQKSPYAAHSLYWMAESYFYLGDWNQAADYYSYILNYYGNSEKKEASYYKKSLIDLLKRENRMLNLLNWTHEKHLNAQLDFRKREEEYLSTIRFYQEKLETLSSEGRDLYNKRELLEIKEELLTIKEFYLREWGRAVNSD